MPSTEQVTTSAAYLPPPDRPHQRTTSPTTTSLPVVGKLNCINCKCPACGFKKLWLDGLRKHVVDGDGNVMDSAPIEFQSEVKWMRIRSSKKTEPGEAKQPNYEPRTGTVVQFLDEFERDIMSKFPHHRFTVHRQKEAAAEFDRNRCPGWVQSDVDFAMDGVILPPKGHAIQSDHWSPPTFTLFNQVCSWLETAAWVSRTSKLNVGDVVTVEPAEGSQSGVTQPAAGSYWAEVVLAPSSISEESEAAEQQLYGVRRHGVSAETPPEQVSSSAPRLHLACTSPASRLHLSCASPACRSSGASCTTASSTRRPSCTSRTIRRTTRTRRKPS